MVANRATYGFRPWRDLTNPTPLTYKVADGYQASLGGNVDLGVGDVVVLVSTGTVALCPGTEGTEGQPAGVITSVIQYYDGTNLVSGDVIPGGSTGGGLHSRATMVEIMPTSSMIWEVQVDDKVTATTRAAYEAFINENCSFVNAETSGRADPKLDISTHATTAGLGWRIVGVSPSEENRDFAEDNIKLLVVGNDVNEAAAAATKIAGV